ncbi:MAG TPA: MBL fold metallo-hydrolase [Bacteroidaceae bacterium]|nr:MBL fold metallo-hydrolase [Bacteroidaceae bacterium]
MFGQSDLQKDVFHTSQGELEIYFVGHGTLMFNFDGKIIHIDPTMREYDYSKMPPADLILITHHHGDHLDATALRHIRKNDTRIVLTETCLETLKDAGDFTVMKNGDKMRVSGIEIEALPAYNIVHKRANGEPYHPKGVGNAYLVELGGKKILIGGDTENIPELKVLKGVNIAFLPMNIPYTMTPEMAADLARAIQPEILYPYHFGNTDTNELVDLLKDQKHIDVRIRDLQ